MRPSAFLREDDAADVGGAVGFVEALRGGSLQTLVVLGGNPAYTLSSNADLAGAISKVPTTIRLGLFEDETSRLCRWHLPQAHYLESWGDIRAWDGTVSVQQPLIEALYGGRAPIELLGELLGGSVASGYEIVRATLKEMLAAPDFEVAWRCALHDGVVAGLAAPSSVPAVSIERVRDLARELLSAEPANTAPPTE